MIIDIGCLIPADLEIQVAAINSTSIRVDWIVQWNCSNEAYSKPPVMFTISVKSSNDTRYCQVILDHSQLHNVTIIVRYTQCTLHLLS